MRRGLTFVEVVVGLFLLGLTVVTAMAIFPLGAFLRDRSGSYSRAGSVIQKKLEQVRQLNAAQINYSGLRAAGIIDEGVPTLQNLPVSLTGTPLEGTNMATSPIYRFTVTDQLANEFVRGEGLLRLSGAGTDLAQVDVVIFWEGLRGMRNFLPGMTYVADKTAWREP